MSDNTQDEMGLRSRRAEKRARLAQTFQNYQMAIDAMAAEIDRLKQDMANLKAEVAALSGTNEAVDVTVKRRMKSMLGARFGRAINTEEVPNG